MPARLVQALKYRHGIDLPLQSPCIVRPVRMVATTKIEQHGFWLNWPAHWYKLQKEFMKILLVVSGMTPQIITETVYGLAVAPEDGVEPWIPDEVHVLSTKSGITQIRGALIDKSRLDGLCAEYDLPKIRFDDSCLHTFQREYKDSDGNTVSENLEDIKSKEDSSTVADRICEKVRELTSDDNVELHVSIAGGRKTMGYYAGYAMSLYGRAQDSMSHVLVSDAFEQVRDFFYPTKESHPVQNRDGHYLDAKDAQVWLMNLPFVRLRSALEKNKVLTDNSFSNVVDKINAAQSDVSVDLKVEDCRVIVSTNSDLAFDIKLNPREFVFLQWIADATQDPEVVPVKRPSVNHLDYLNHVDQLTEAFNAYYTDRARSIDEDRVIEIDSKYFDEVKSSLRKSLTKTLGLDLVNRLLPTARNKGLTLGIASDKIRMLKDWLVRTTTKSQPVIVTGWLFILIPLELGKFLNRIWL